PDSVESSAEDARRIGVKALAVRGDVARVTDMVTLVAKAVDELGRLDVLVTCAGVDGPGLLTDQDDATWTRVIDVNLNGTYRAIKAALPHMMARRSGRIVTIASIFGKHGGYGYITAYTASKHGVIGLTRALAAELGAQGYPGITVNAICPGYVRAGMGIRQQHTKAGPLSGAEIFDRYFKRQVPLRRLGVGGDPDRRRRQGVLGGCRSEEDDPGRLRRQPWLQPGLSHEPRPGRHHARPSDLEADDRRHQRFLSGRWPRAGAGL